MSLRILVIDDQIARSEEEQILFLRAIGELSGSGPQRNRSALFDVVYSSGQAVRGGVVVNDIATAVKSLQSHDDWALILLDMQFDSGVIGTTGIISGQQGDTLFGLQIERALLSEQPGLPIVRFTSKPESELGESERPYLAKLNLSQAEFRSILFQHGRLNVAQKIELLEVKNDTFLASPSMLQVYFRALKFAGTDDPLLITGESGTGKEVLAKYIHNHSGRAASPFIPVNVAAMPQHLVDTELFGHERGAFTGADRQLKGYFEQVQGGTVFLDEIGDMPIDHQLRLLRVLQERQFRRVGGAAFIPFNGRSILATHRNLIERMQNGLFREDLYNRLTLTLSLPPLRERCEEIIPLAERFISQYAQEMGKEGIFLDESARQKLVDYTFPGNVRELAALMKSAVLEAGNNRRLRADDINTPVGVILTPAVQVAGVNISAAPSIASGTDLSKAVEGLEGLVALIRDFNVSVDDLALHGAKPRLEDALNQLLRRCAAMCMDSCRHPISHKIRLLPAMQMLEGDSEIKGTRASRILKNLLGLHHSSDVSAETMEAFCNSELTNSQHLDEQQYPDS